MDLLLLAMRPLHVVLGTFWVGTLVFNALFLQPAIRDAGPDGAKVAAALMRRRFLDVMPLVAIVTILSGLWLYWHVSGGFQPEFMGSRTGMALGVGAAAAFVAFALGVVVMRPAMLHAAELSKAAAQAAGPDGDARLATAQRLRAKAAAVGRWVAALLTLSVAAMALARYV